MPPEARVAAPLTSDEAASVAAELYSLTVLATPLPGEYDDNFKLVASDGRAFVLKLMHPSRAESFVDMQCRALLHLARRAPHLALPRVIPTAQKQLFTNCTLSDGLKRIVWLLTFLPGTVLAEAKPHTTQLFASLGTILAEIDAALLDFIHPAARREFKWDVSRSSRARDFLPHVHDPQKRALAKHFLNLFEQEAVPSFPHLRQSVIYGDANDYNALVGPALSRVPLVQSLIDFGDMHLGLTIAEPAVAAAYAVLSQENPLPAAAAILSAYHRVFPLNEHEIAAFFSLLAARLAVSVINSAHRKSLVPDDPYVTVTEAPAWSALERLAKISPRFAHYTFRAACGLSAVPHAEKTTNWLAGNFLNAAPIVPLDLRNEIPLVLDLSVASTLLGADPSNAVEARMTPLIRTAIRDAKASFAIGRYNEARPVYTSPLFASSENPLAERRTIHLGIDLFADPGTPISAPFDATVHALANNSAPLDYGPVVILRHVPASGIEFFTLYGHLSTDSLENLSPGQYINRGETFARLGHAHENGGWTPHLHFQLILDLLDLSTDFPGVAFASQREVWTSLSPDPNVLLGISPDRFPVISPDVSATLSARQSLLGKNLSVSYDSPLKIVRGWRQYLYDHTGRAFLDVYNNVPLVGHSHPRVVAAAQRQLALLNTNTRYLHDNVLHYAQRLTQLLPAPLRVCFFVNSGSEANELALRLARTHTKKEDIVVVEHAYHGHSSTLIDISPYKFNGPGGSGRKPWVHVAPIADEYRGLYRRPANGHDPELGKKYAAHVADLLVNAKREGRSVAAFIAETLPSVAGQIVFPPGYLAEVYQHIRAAGGVCIADEVQVGFGRLGTHFWGFAAQDVVPDIVVFGKPIGNAFPLAAVVTTPEIAASFANGMEFFSTFGGNPVACAVGLAVLDVLDGENLQENALTVGSQWKRDLRSLQSSHPIIGDVRGSGFFLGIDLVNDRDARTPATQQALYVVNRLRDLGILAGTDGPHHNVLKLRPPLPFSIADSALFTSALSQILSEDPSQPV